MRNRILLGGVANDLHARKSRETIFNGYIETTNDGSIKRIKRTPGLSEFDDLTNGPIRGMYEVGNKLIVVNFDEVFVYTLNSTSGNQFVTKESAGSVPSGQQTIRFATLGADILQVALAGLIDPETGDPQGFILEFDPLTLTAIFDVDFSGDQSVTSLLNRFMWNNPDSSKYIGSGFSGGVPDGFTYSALDFNSAIDKPGPIRMMASANGNLVIFKSTSVELHQSVLNTTKFPFRRITGATLDRGILAPQSLAQVNDDFIFLADDYTVQMVHGNQMKKLSDLALELEIRGDTSLEFQQPSTELGGQAVGAGYKNPEDAEGFMIDSTVHKVYVLNFIAQDVTWCFDLSTGLWHRRKSRDIGRWRPKVAARVFDRVFFGDYKTGQIWEQDVTKHLEGDELQEFIVQTPAISADKTGLFISEIEFVCEVGVGNIANTIPNSLEVVDNDDTITNETIHGFLPTAPMMLLEWSKDGGATFTGRRNISLGRIGERQHRVITRNFGYVARHQEFVLRFAINENVRTEFYELWVDGEEGQ